MSLKDFVHQEDEKQPVLSSSAAKRARTQINDNDPEEFNIPVYSTPNSNLVQVPKVVTNKNSKPRKTYSMGKRQARAECQKIPSKPTTLLDNETILAKFMLGCCRESKCL